MTELKQIYKCNVCGNITVLEEKSDCSYFLKRTDRVMSGQDSI